MKWQYNAPDKEDKYLSKKRKDITIISKEDYSSESSVMTMKIWHILQKNKKKIHESKKEKVRIKKSPKIQLYVMIAKSQDTSNIIVHN